MMERALDRAAQLARARQETATARVAIMLNDMLPDASVTVEGTDVVAMGKGLLNIWLTDGELRFLADNFE